MATNPGAERATGQSVGQNSMSTPVNMSEVEWRTREQFESGASQGGAEVLLPEWPANLRLLDRLDPGWRDEEM